MRCLAASTNLLTVVLNTMFRYWLAGMVILSCARVALEEHGDCSKELRQSDSHLSSTHPLNINRNQPFNLKTRHETITRYSHNLALLSSPPVHTTPLLEWNATETTPALCPARVPTQVPEHRLRATAATIWHFKAQSQTKWRLDSNLQPTPPLTF